MSKIRSPFTSYYLGGGGVSVSKFQTFLELLEIVVASLLSVYTDRYTNTWL